MRSGRDMSAMSGKSTGRMRHTKRMRQTPAGDDTPVMAMMRELGIPLTRKNYLEVNYLGCRMMKGRNRSYRKCFNEQRPTSQINTRQNEVPAQERLFNPSTTYETNIGPVVATINTEDDQNKTPQMEKK
jgi:hypothetical protein